MPPAAPVDRIDVRVLSVPTDAPEADGTFEWSSTTMVLVEARASGITGLGYTYCDAAAGGIVERTLAPFVCGLDALDVPRAQAAMVRAVRNMGWPGIAAAAISAVDTALWDLKARLLDVPLAHLFGTVRDAVPIYGSGGFTSYADDRLAAQLAGWVDREGCRAVKMKIGADGRRDAGRMRLAKEAIGSADLMIDANGALARKQALNVATLAAGLGVVWFEEPVSSDDPEGLRLLVERAPPPVAIAAGEYGYTPFHFRRLLEAGAVDVLQADATRAGGYTGFLVAAALAGAHGVPLSAHTAPAVHLPVCLAVPGLLHLEWFHDHVRIEAMLFEGAPHPHAGSIRADPSRPGNGLTLVEREAARFAA